MNKKTISNIAGRIRADELGGFRENDALSSDDLNNDTPSFGEVNVPTPYFDGGNWQIDAIHDEDDDGRTCTTYWLVPRTTRRLEIKYRYLKKDGSAYGPIKYDSARVPKEVTEAAIPLFEWTIDKLKSNRKLDIVQAIAHLGKRASNDTAENPDGTLQTTPDVGDDAEIAGSPTNGQGGYGGAGHNLGAALARIVIGSYIIVSPRVKSIGTAEKEQDGVYRPITFEFDLPPANVTACRLAVWYARCGKKAGTGISDSNTYGRTRKKSFVRLTTAELTTDVGSGKGNATRYLGPFGPKQARKTWHILRVTANCKLDDAALKKNKEFYPANDTDISTAANDTSPANSFAPIPGRNGSFSSGTPENPNGTSAGPMLGILTQIEEVDGVLSGFALSTSLDDATEPDDDAFIKWSATIKDASGTNTITAADANATEAVLVYMRQSLYTGTPSTDQPNYKHDRVALNPDDTTVGNIFDKKSGRKFHLIKVVLQNPISKAPLSLTSFSGGPVSSGVFVAGQSNGGYRESDAHTGIGTLSLSAIDSGESNKVTLELSIPNNGVGGIPVIPKRVFPYVSKRGVTSDPGSLPTAPNNIPTSGNGWRLEKSEGLKNRQDLVTIATVKVQFDIKLRRKKTHWIKVRLYVVGSATPIDLATSITYDSDSQLPNQNYGISPNNMLSGGDFSHSKDDVDGSGSTTKPALDWESWVSVTGGFNNDIDTTTGQLLWVPSSRWLRWNWNGGAFENPAGRMRSRRLKPGKKYTVSFRVRSNTSAGGSNIAIWGYFVRKVGAVFTQLSNSPGLLRTNTINASTGDFVSLSFTITMGTYTTDGRDVYFVLDQVANTSGRDLQITDIMIVPGLQAFPFSPNPIEENWINGAGTSRTYSDTDVADYANNGGGNDYNTNGDLTWE